MSAASQVIDRLARQPCPWLEQGEGHDGIVLSSRIRLARNLRGHAFRRQLDIDQQEALVMDLASTARTCPAWRRPPHRLHLEQLAECERLVLLERRLISRELAQQDEPAAVLVEPDGSASMMINEEDHVRLQVLAPGLRIEEVLARAIALDAGLEERLPWASDDRWGYLTSCPTNIGTGLRASVMMHLPALAETQELPRVLRALGKLAMTARGLLGEGSEATGHHYQISNQRTLGRTEGAIAADLQQAVEQLLRAEQLCREVLLDRQRWRLEDKVHRAWGLLTHARSLTSNELVAELGWLRLGRSLKLIERPSTNALDALLVMAQPGHLCLHHPEAADEALRDRLRAELVRGCLDGNAAA